MITFLNHLGSWAATAGTSMFLQSAALVLVVAVIERTVGRRLPAAWRCALWLLVVIKLLLPPSLKSPTGLGFWLGRWFADPVILTTTTASRSAVTSAVVERPIFAREIPVASSSSPPPAATLNPLGWAMLLWLAGSVVLTLGILRRNREVQRLVRESEPTPPEFLKPLRNAAAQLGLRCLPDLRLTRANHSPAVCGLIHPVILLPASLARVLAPAALRDVLLHELVHVQRRDLWLNVPQCLAQVLWWWNPCVWVANARIRALREEAVDERVMLTGPGGPHTYPASLVEVARHCADQPSLALSFVGILETRRTLRSRVERLLDRPLPRRAALGISGWLTLLVAALLALPMAFARRVEVVTVQQPVAAETPTQPNPGPAPAAVSNAPPAPSNIYRMDPELARRYGLIPPGATNPPATNGAPGQTQRYRMDPTLAARYGLVPSSNPTPAFTTNPLSLSGSSAGSPAPLNLYQMDPVLARRYGLVPPIPMLDRIFRIDFTNYLNSLETITERRVRTGTAADRVLDPATGSPLTLVENVQELFREYFRQAGADLSRPPKTFYFDENTHALFVRAPAADLEVIERSLQALRGAPTQIQIDVKLIELGEGDEPGPGFDSLITGANGRFSFIQTAEKSHLPSEVQLLRRCPGSRILADLKQVATSGSPLRLSLAELPSLTPANSAPLESGRGPGLDFLELTPNVGPDGLTIDLSIIARWHRVKATGEDLSSIPIVMKDEFSANTAMPSGQALVFGGRVGPEIRSPRPGGNSAGNDSPVSRKRVLLFITPSIVDPAGK